MGNPSIITIVEIKKKIKKMTQLYGDVVVIKTKTTTHF